MRPVMSAKWLKFNRNLADKSVLPESEAQFINFPNHRNDDIIDCFAQWVAMFEKKWLVNNNSKKNKRKIIKVRDPYTWQLRTKIVRWNNNDIIDDED